MSLFRLFGIKKSLVTDIRNGRSGKLQYRGDGKFAVAYYEVSGVPEYDILVWFSAMKSWSDGTVIAPEEKQIILSEFEAWAKRNKTRCQW